MTGLSGSFVHFRTSENINPNEELLRLLVYSDFREQLSESAQELHNLTDTILFHKSSAPDTSIKAQEMILPLLVMLMESREKAKRVYRNALSSRMCIRDWNIDPLCDEMHGELIRTSELLKLYPRRDSLW